MDNSDDLIGGSLTTSSGDPAPTEAVANAPVDLLKGSASSDNPLQTQFAQAMDGALATVKKRTRENGLSDGYYKLLDTFKRQTQDAMSKRLGAGGVQPVETPKETPPAHKVEMKKLGVWGGDNDAEESPFVNVNGVDVSMRNIDAKNGGDVQARAGIVKEMQDAMRKFYSED